MASEPRFIVIVGATLPGYGSLAGALHTQGNLEGKTIDLVPVVPKVVNEYERDGEKVVQFLAKLPPDPTHARHLPCCRLRFETVVGTVDEIVERFRRQLELAAERTQASPQYQYVAKEIEEAGLDSLRVIDSVTP